MTDNLRIFFIEKPEIVERRKCSCFSHWPEPRECFTCGTWKAEIYEENKLYTTALTSECYNSWVSDYAVLYLIRKLINEKYKGKIIIGSYDMINYDIVYINEMIKGKYGNLEDNDFFWVCLAKATKESRQNEIIINVLNKEGWSKDEFFKKKPSVLQYPAEEICECGICNKKFRHLHKRKIRVGGQCYFRCEPCIELMNNYLKNGNDRERDKKT